MYSMYYMYITHLDVLTKGLAKQRETFPESGEQTEEQREITIAARL